MKVSISKQNTKLGKVHNISLPPGATCDPNAPCLKECYAMKAWRMYPNVRTAWGNNLLIATADMMGYFESVGKWIDAHNVEMFRWHVSGDIPNKAYYDGMCLLAECFEHVKFLAFTKRENFFREPRPSNLVMAFSMWPGMAPVGGWKMFRETMECHGPLAWLEPTVEQRESDPEYAELYDNVVVDEALSCQGKCDQCFLCWFMGPKTSVRFHKH